MSKYLTSQQVAAYLSVSDRTVRNLEKSNQIPPPVMVGGIKRWNVDELDAFLKEHSKKEGESNATNG